LSFSFSYLKPPAGGGFPTPRAQFINNGFGLGEFLGKREMQRGIINRNEQLTDSLGLEKPKEGTN